MSCNHNRTDFCGLCFTDASYELGKQLDKKLEAVQIDKSNPKDLLGIKKPQLNLVPPSSIVYQALAMEDGAVKYGAYNWRENNVKASIYYAAAIRHLGEWFDGQTNADDSKKPHLGHALACIGIIVDALENGNLIDDRPKPGSMSKVIQNWKKT